MKKTLHFLCIVAIIALCLSAFSSVAIAAPAFDHDGFVEYGQKVHNINSKFSESKVAIDGVVRDGEYVNAPIVLTELGDDFYWADWSKDGLTAEEIEDILPEKISYYVEYDEEGICVAAEIVEPTPYSICEYPMDLWGLDSLEIDICIDSEGRIPQNTFTHQNMTDRVRTTFGLVETFGALVPMGFCYTASSYGNINKDQELETFEITRNEETGTTTYEIFYAWESLWDGGVPSEVFINFQLHISDEEYLDSVADGYVACIGGLRYSCKLSDEVKTEYGLSGNTVYHVFNLVDRPEDESDDKNEGEQGGETEGDNTQGGNTQGGNTQEENTQGENTQNNKPTSPSTDKSDSGEDSGSSTDKSGGCGSTLTPMATFAVLSLCSGALLVKRKKEDK